MANLLELSKIQTALCSMRAIGHTTDLPSFIKGVELNRKWKTQKSEDSVPEPECPFHVFTFVVLLLNRAEDFCKAVSCM